MMKITGIDSGGYSGLFDMGDMWVPFHLDEAGNIILGSAIYEKSEFRNRAHFAGVMGKFVPYLIILDKDVKMAREDITSEALKKLVE